MDTTTEATPKETITAWAEKHGVTMTAEFVPWSQSRNKGEKYPTLNWRVTLSRNGRDFLTTDYSAGCAHCPSYKQQFGKRTIEDREREERVKFECETGLTARIANYGRTIQCSIKNGKTLPILPDFADVLYSLSMDASVIDSGGFESWASDLGYDTDSRAAEAIYRACLDAALKMRAALGDVAMGELATATQDY